MEPQRSSKLQPDMGVCVCGNGMFRWVRRVERKTGTPNEIFRAVREINRKGNHNSVPYIESIITRTRVAMVYSLLKCY